MNKQNLILCLIFTIGCLLAPIVKTNDNELAHFLKRYVNEFEVNDDLPTIDDYLSQSLAKEDSQPEYKKFFGTLLNDENEKQSLLENSDDKNSESSFKRKNSKHKRFLQSIMDKFFNKKTKTTTQSTTTSTQARLPITTSSTTKSIITNKNTLSTLSTYYQPIYLHSTPQTVHETEDAFYKMKQYCAKNFDDFCRTKKKEIYDLVVRCESLSMDRKAKVPDACKDVLSIYCYIYYNKDMLTCYGGNYQPYKPGSNKYVTSSSSPLTTTASSRRIPIIIITPSKPFYTTPKTTTTTTTTTTTKRQTPSPTTKSTSPKFYTTPSLRPVPSSSKSNNEPSSPFSGPITNVPNDADKLKKIGQYCVKIKTKDQNCDKSLALLKEKFKSCEKMPKSDNECQSFKMNFCSAFTQFPCCADVLAGRTCSGKSNSRRSLYLM